MLNMMMASNAPSPSPTHSQQIDGDPSNSIISPSSSSTSNISSTAMNRSVNANQYNLVDLATTIASGKSLPFDENKLIINVWSHNLRSEFDRIVQIVDEYPYIAMDTEFPGVVARPVGSFKNSSEYHYQTLKCNVDLLKIIQLGLCFADENGNIYPGHCTWQFNFKFSLSEDMYAQDSIDLLAKSGISFSEHDLRGIDVLEFGELFMTSGIVLNPDVKWISFHSGYDYGYLLKLLTCTALPNSETEFFEMFNLFFPCVYDIKYVMKSCENLNGGLQKLAEQLQLERIGPQHQAGSDALLSAATFFKMKEVFFENGIDDEKFAGVLFGLGADSGAPQPTIYQKRKPNSSLNNAPSLVNSSSSASPASSASSSTPSTSTPLSINPSASPPSSSMPSSSPPPPDSTTNGHSVIVNANTHIGTAAANLNLQVAQNGSQ